jgi:hypothetical protein
VLTEQQKSLQQQQRLLKQQQDLLKLQQEKTLLLEKAVLTPLASLPTVTAQKRTRKRKLAEKSDNLQGQCRLTSWPVERFISMLLIFHAMPFYQSFFDLY